MILTPWGSKGALRFLGWEPFGSLAYGVGRLAADKHGPVFALSDDMSDSDLPELPAPVEPKRPEPIERYMTQQLTRAVPQAEHAPEPEPEPTDSTWQGRLRSFGTQISTKARGLSRKQLAIGGGALLLFLVVILAATGSDDADAVASPLAKVDDQAQESGADWIDAQLTAWDDADLEPGGFAEVDASVFGASECRGGAASALEITLCSFATAAAAADGKTPAENSIGKNTGVVIADGQRLLIVADRRTADPSGKTINRLVKAFIRD